MNLFLYGHKLANSFFFVQSTQVFFTNDKNIFFEAQITFFASLFIWFTIPEYFPPHVKGSVGIFESPLPFGQFRLISSVRVSEGCQVISVLFFEVSGY